VTSFVLEGFRVAGRDSLLAERHGASSRLTRVVHVVPSNGRSGSSDGYEVGAEKSTA
jgi:hypothetical protein